MSISIQSATSILGLVNSTVTAAKSAVELAKKTTNSELKEKVNEVLDGILDLKGTVLSLKEENRLLKAKIQERGTITRNPQFGYWFREGEVGPLCPKCYEGDERLVYLSPLRSGSRKCRVCNSQYYENGPSTGTIAIGSPSITSRARNYWE